MMNRCTIFLYLIFLCHDIYGMEIDLGKYKIGVLRNSDGEVILHNLNIYSDKDNMDNVINNDKSEDSYISFDKQRRAMNTAAQGYVNKQEDVFLLMNSMPDLSSECNSRKEGYVIEKK